MSVETIEERAPCGDAGGLRSMRANTFFHYKTDYPADISDCRVTFGLNAGYGDHTADAAFDWGEISEILHQEIDYVRELSGVVVGCVVDYANVFYPREFGCPEVGERALVVTGAHNPKLGGALSWREAVETLTERLKDRFRQERVTLTIVPCETIYLEPSVV